MKVWILKGLEGVCRNERSGGLYLGLLVREEVKQLECLFLLVTCSEKCRRKESLLDNKARVLVHLRNGRLIDALCLNGIWESPVQEGDVI